MANVLYIQLVIIELISFASNFELKGFTMLKNILLLWLCSLCFSVQAHPIKNKEKIILLAIGSFNPPTLMHLRMFGKTRSFLNFSAFYPHMFQYFWLNKPEFSVKSIEISFFPKMFSLFN